MLLLIIQMMKQYIILNEYLEDERYNFPEIEMKKICIEIYNYFNLGGRIKRLKMKVCAKTS